MSNPNLPSQLTFHDNGGTFPAYGVITAEDHGPVVVTFNWIFYCLTGLAVVGRFATRRNWTMDSFLLLAAAVLLTGESVAVHQAASNGLGRRSRSLDDATYEKYSKAFYGSQILKIMTLTVTKMSFMFIFKRLVSASSNQMKHMNGVFHLLLGLFVTWGVGTVFAFAFQCSLPRPWDTAHGTCANRPTLYYITGIINMMTDLVIIAIPAIIVYNVRVKKTERAVIIGIFATRIITVIAAAVELGYMADFLWSDDPTWNNESATIWGQAMLNLSVITACLPLMKPFLDMLQFSLVDSSTLPFSAQAGVYYETHPNVSPQWSREKNSGAYNSSSSGSRQNASNQGQRTWKVSQAPPRATWKQHQPNQHHRQPSAQPKSLAPGQVPAHKMSPPPPQSQYSPNYVPTGYSPHCSVGAPSIDAPGRASGDTLVAGRITDPRW